MENTDPISINFLKDESFVDEYFNFNNCFPAAEEKENSIFDIENLFPSISSKFQIKF